MEGKTAAYKQKQGAMERNSEKQREMERDTTKTGSIKANARQMV